MKKLVLIAFLVPTLAYAQPVQQPATYNLVVSPAELDVISKGLGTQPFNDVLPLINKLRQQVMEQQPKPAAKVEEKPVDKPAEAK
jgi:hypothetical protein